MVKYFGTDGIRAEAKVILDQRFGYWIGKSLKMINHDRLTVFVARDTRQSGSMIIEQIKKGLFESGIDVYDLGVFPTPVLAYFTQLNQTYGMMVTASHNPYTDNGIKIFNQGKKLSKEEESLIEKVIDGEIMIEEASSLGKNIEFKEAMNQYETLYKDVFVQSNLKIALDLANGAATSTAERIFSKITPHLVVVANQPNGENINRDCGSTHLGLLQQTVIEHECDLGIAFDGDADRLMVVDHQGEICDGDILIYLFASYLKAHKLLKNKFVALSKMCNIGIIKALKEKDIDVIQTDVGDKYIFEAIEKNDGVLGGENSGHIINKLLFDSGDGVLNGAFLIKVLEYYKLPLNKLKEQVNYYPDKLVNLRDYNKDLVNEKQVIDLVDMYRKRLGDDGKVLVRASGTENLIRISVSALTEQLVEEIIDDIKSLIIKLSNERNIT